MDEIGIVSCDVFLFGGACTCVLVDIAGSHLSNWRRKCQPTPVFLPGESHGQRSLEGYSLWGHKESDTTERLTHTHTHISLKGNAVSSRKFGGVYAFSMSLGSPSGFGSIRHAATLQPLFLQPC